jgi:anaerobic ribonucleoside-triphosphate reductase
MDEQKQMWLRSQALNTPISDIADCDLVAQQVTMADGRVRQVTERYTRVMGYHRPVSAYNCGKQSEHRDRMYFSEKRADVGSA